MRIFNRSRQKPVRVVEHDSVVPIEVVIHAFVRDEGSVVVFGATRTDNGREVCVAVDHGCAGPITRALDFENPVVDIESWQLLGYVS